jgi:hypothetical protein
MAFAIASPYLYFNAADGEASGRGQNGVFDGSSALPGAAIEENV